MGTWNYFWHFIFSVFLYSTTSAASSATAPPGETPNQSWESGMTADHNIEMNRSLPATLLVTPSTLPMMGGEGRTETALMTSTWEGNSTKVPAGSEAMSPPFPAPRPGTTDTSMDTSSGTAASLSLSLRPSSAAMSHSSSSSSPDGFIAATTTLQKRSTSGNTEVGLAATSHPSTALSPSAPSSTPAVTSIGSDSVSANALTHGPAPSVPSSMPLASTSSMFPSAVTTESSLSFTMAGSALMQAAQLTSTSPTQGHTMTDSKVTSSSPGATLAASATTCAANPDTALPSKAETPRMNEGSGLTTDPSTQTIHSLPSTLLVTPSMPLKMEGEARTETALMTSTWEGSSLEVSARSEAVSPTFPMPSPGTTDTSMDTTSGTAASLSLSLRPSSAALNHSFSSFPVGFTAATTTPQKSSTSKNTEEELAATSHPSLELVSSAPSSTPAFTSIGSGTVSTHALTHGPAPSVPSSMLSAFASSTSSAAETTEFSLSFTMAGSTTMHAAQLTSAPRRQGQTMTEAEYSSSSSGSPLAAMATTSAASRVTTPLSKGETPTMNHGSGPMAESSTKMARSFPVTSFATPFPKPSPSSTDAGMDISSGTAVSLSFRPNSAATSHSFSSSDGLTAIPTTLQQRSTSSNTEESLATTSHPSMPLMSSGPSSTPAVTAIGSRTVTANSLTHGPALSAPSSMPLSSTSSMFPAAATTVASLLSTLTGSTTTQAAQLTSTPLTQGQTTTEAEATSSSPWSPLAAMASTSAASEVTAPPGKGKTLNTNTESSLTADPNTKMTRFIPASSLANPSTLPMMGGEWRTEAGSTKPTWEGSSTKVSVWSVLMSPTFPTPTPSSTATSMDTASDTAASLSLRPSSVATSHSSFSSLDGFTAATTTLPQSSTSSTTEESLATTSHLSMSLLSSAPSSTPAVTGNIQMTTVPPKSAMARFTRSTANPIFTTTFASGPCMPVSIKVQNVTGDAIQVSWTGGRRGNLYTISLMYGNWEINRTITKETKTVFEHLLPGHVYTVSVEAQSCAEDSRTSVNVRTDPVSCFNRTEFCLLQNTACPDLKYIVCSSYQAFTCSVLFKSQIFNHTLYDSESEDYKTMSESIKTEVVREMRIRLKDDQFNIIMLGFRPGSVIADFISLLQTRDSIDVNAMQTHLSQILKNKFGDQIEVTIQSLSAQSSTEKSSTWKVAVIVLGVLLGVALVLIFLITLLYICMKKRSGEYLVEPKGLLGNFVYKHL